MADGYIPLVLPSLGANPDFSAAANFLATSAENLVSSGNSFIQSLGDLKAIDFSQVGDLPVFQTAVFLGDVGNISQRPTRPTVNYDVSGLLQQLSLLVAPSAPTNSFAYADPGYTSSLRDPMNAKILNDLLYGGYGIDPNDEINLWNRERDRESLLAQSNIDEAKRQAAATSFPLPTGALYLQLQRARQDYQNKISSVNRDIGLKRADLYVQNRQFTIEKALASEDQSIALYNSIQNRAVDVAKVQVDLAIAVFQAGISLFTARLDAIVKQIEAQLDSAKLTVDIYASDVAAYAAYVNALVASAQVAIENSRNLFNASQATYQSNVDIVKFRLEQLRLTVTNAAQINEFGSEFFRTALGSTMSGISGLAVQTTSS